MATPNRYNSDLFGPQTGSEWPDGFILKENLADLGTQTQIYTDLQRVVAQAPLKKAMTKTGGYTSAAITNCGDAGWWSDRKGYRYERANPTTGAPWPTMPDSFRRIVGRAIEESPWPKFVPDACLINFYGPGAKMGLHQDKDEADFSHPIITVCLGDSADFLVGGPKRGDKPQVLVVRSGDVMMMGGNCRLFYHGVRRTYPGTSPISALHGRFSLTFRKAL